MLFRGWWAGDQGEKGTDRLNWRHDSFLDGEKRTGRAQELPNGTESREAAAGCVGWETGKPGFLMFAGVLVASPGEMFTCVSTMETGRLGHHSWYQPFWSPSLCQMLADVGEAGTPGVWWAPPLPDGL